MFTLEELQKDFPYEVFDLESFKGTNNTDVVRFFARNGEKVVAAQFQLTNIEKAVSHVDWKKLAIARCQTKVKYYFEEDKND